MLKLDPDEEDSAAEDLNKSKLNNTFNSDCTDQVNESSQNLNNSSCLENSTPDATAADQTNNDVNKVNYHKSNKVISYIYNFFSHKLINFFID